ncbi:MAG: FecR domain-containing protein [Betaproteobacteria bacterium]|nr:FecR domain-containing protein [Betaproteobacteria bacterium]MDH4324657.1 FecR domain-containing protein [Betaproteobacteria bacterium]
MLRCLLLAALCLPVLAQAQARVAGKIELAEGFTRVEGKDQRSRRPAVGEAVHEGDTIATARQAEVHLRMADGASIIVRERTRITITAYVADGGSEDRSLIDLAEGALRAITGWIGKYNRDRYAVRTPLVTIGVRGTDHEPTHLLEGDPRGKPGSYDKVNDGRAVMLSTQGSVEIPANKAAYLSLAGVPPQLLDAIPDFFKPGRYEQEFTARARQVERALDDLRKGRVDELMKLKDGKLELPKAPTREQLRRGLGDLFKR